MVLWGWGMEIEISVGIVAEESSLLKCFVGYDVWSDGDCAECFVTGEIYWLWKMVEYSRIYFEWNYNYWEKYRVIIEHDYEENIVIIIGYEYCIGSN